MGPMTGMSPKSGILSIRKVFLKDTCSTSWTTRAKKMQNAVEKVLRAVLLMVWSAFKLIDANACSNESSIPIAMEMRIAAARQSQTGMDAWNLLTNKIPQNPPNTMMPSSAMFSTPLRSENSSPSATTMSGTKKIIVCWQRK